MSREIILEALNGIRDEFITEAGAKLGLLAVGAAGAVGAASGAAVDPSTLYSLSGTEATVKTGFGAWVAKGGWIALAAGVVVAAGVAAGVFFFGKGGDMPPAGTEDVTTEDAEQGSFEDTDEESSNSTEENTQGGIHDETTEETEPQVPVFDVTASLAAIDRLASENVSVSMKYQTKTYDGLSHEFSGGFGQVNGKHWYRVDMDGIAVQEEESGYYHKYTFESSKWRYYDTYEMTATEEFDRVFNGRYWWKNYLDELTFDAYDKLTYVGIGQVAEQDCHTFTFDGTVTDGSQAELTLYVRVTDRNVMRMEVQIKSSPNSSHLSTDAWQAAIEISGIKTGQDAKGPTLPKPKWEPPENSPEI